jgi:hypothetical protein
MSKPLKRAGFSQGIFQTSSTRKEQVGTKRITQNGDVFIYSKAGAVLSAGKATGAAEINSNHIDGTISATNVEGSQVTVTVSAGTAIAENALAGGSLQVNDGTLEGNSYPIVSNTALGASDTEITLSLGRPLKDYDGTTEVTLAHNPAFGVTHSTTEEKLFTGIPPVDVPSGYYFWSQTGGVAVALISGTPTVGSMMTMGSVSGSLAAINATLDVDQPIVGILWGAVGVDGEYKPVKLTVN